MTISIDRGALLAALKKCLPGVDKGTCLFEGADTFMFTPGFVHAYNDAIAVSAPLQAEGLVGAVKAVDFFKLVSKMRASLLTIEATATQWEVTGGRTKSRQTLVDSSQIKAYVATMGLASAQWEELPKTFMDAVKLCQLSANTSKLRGVMVGCPEGSSVSLVMATDSVRIACHALDRKLPDFWLDDPNVNELVKLGDPTHYCVVGPWLHIKYADGSVFSAKTKDCAGYPVTIIKQNVDTYGGAATSVEGKFPKDIAESVDRVATMAAAQDGCSSLVRLTFRKDTLGIYASKATGDAEEVVPWDEPLGTDPNIVVYVESAFLVEASKKGMDFKVSEIEGSTAVMFTSGDFKNFVMTQEGPGTSGAAPSDGPEVHGLDD